MTEPLGQWTNQRTTAYTYARDDVMRHLPECAGPVLDIGCSNGASGAWLKQERPHQVVWGVEADSALADAARERLDRVLEGDATECLKKLKADGVKLGAVVMADVLEHLIDPWMAFDLAVSLVHPGGWVLASIPNVGHWDTLWNVLRGRWPYRDRGIHDDTHLRFFAIRNVEDLFARPGLRLAKMHRNYRFVERPHDVNRHAQRMGRFLPRAFVFQFIALGQVER